MSEIEMIDKNWKEIYKVIENDDPTNILTYIEMMIDLVSYLTNVPQKEIIEELAAVSAYVNSALNTEDGNWEGTNINVLVGFN